MAQSVKHLTWAQVVILRFGSSNPMLGSMLMAQNLEPALDSMSSSLSAPPPLAHVCVRTAFSFSLSLSLSLSLS